MFFDAPLQDLAAQASARPDLLRQHYAMLLAETRRRDAELLSQHDPGEAWLAGEIERIEALRATGGTPALFGVSVGVKDTLVVSGLPTRSGTTVDIGAMLQLPQSPAVTALQEAGAVIVAKQATNQFCSSAGPAATRSIRGEPYFAGGSTVGGAVAVAAGFTRLALGSDAAGSIRHPAALAGIAGLRPRKGTISDEGQVNGLLSGQSTGLLARSADDIATALESCPKLYIPLPDETVSDKERPTIGIPDSAWVDIDPAAEAALRSAVARLVASGYEVVPTSVWQTQEAQDDFFRLMSFENWLFHRPLIASHADIYEPAVASVVRIGEAIDPRDAEAVRRRLVDHRKRFFDLAGQQGIDILLTPSVPRPDILKQAGTPRELSSIGGRFTAVSNIYDVDSITLPTEQAPGGWPRSVMLHGLTVPLSRLLACARLIDLQRSPPATA